MTVYASDTHEDRLVGSGIRCLSLIDEEASRHVTDDAILVTGIQCKAEIWYIVECGDGIGYEKMATYYFNSQEDCDKVVEDRELNMKLRKLAGEECIYVYFKYVIEI